MNNNDTLRFNDIDVNVNIDLAEETATREVRIGMDENSPITESFDLTDVANIVGSNENDTIVGDENDNLIRGSLGNDFIIGLGGNDIIDGGGGVDTLDGGEGNDILSFATIGVAVNADLNIASASYQPTANVTIVEEFTSFENLEGSLQDDQLFGDAGENFLNGLEGNDLLVGAAGGDILQGRLGDDTLRGGGGSDVTDGGEGNDTADFVDIGVGVTADLAAGTANYVANGNNIQDEFIEIENLAGSLNDDILNGDDAANIITGNAGNDSINGGEGSDTVRFDDIDVGVSVDLSADNAQRETGFEINIDSLALVDPNDGIDTAAIISEGIDGNLYFNFHTTEFPSGELRGQLELSADNRDANGVGTVIFNSSLSGDQEVQDEPVITDAFGTATATFTIAENGSISYNTEVSINGLNQADLLPVDIGNGTLSPIHLHNAPADANGPVVVDVFTDAGAGGIVAVEETDTLVDIENAVGSNDGDLIIGDAEANIFEGLDGNDTLRGGLGDDTLRGGGGSDVTNGGEGNDTADFVDIGVSVTADLASGTANYVANGNNIQDDFVEIENLAGSLNDDVLSGDEAANLIAGNEGNDLLVGAAGADTLRGGLGDDTLRGGGGSDVTNGGEGNDTADFVDIGVSVTADLFAGTANYVANGNNIQDDFVEIENLAGSLNDDVLSGDNGLNIVGGNEGNDTLAGGGNADTFNFSFNSGADVITDFETVDTLVVGDFFQNSSEALGAAIQDGSDTIINLDNDNSIVLENFIASDLNAENFSLT